VQLFKREIKGIQLGKEAKYPHLKINLFPCSRNEQIKNTIKKAIPFTIE
jgi:hypothetical protein